MLEATYIHCPGIGAKTERRLWSAGARTWAEFVALGEELRLSAAQRGRLAPLVAESVARLEAGDYAWFARHLPPREHWRAFTAFRDRIAYLDIETTGGVEPYDLTTVGVYDGRELRQFVRGFNLDEFPAAIENTALLVTFFGSGFDLPFLRRAFRMEFPQLHIDLCFMLKRLGYSGGLKQVEEDFGITRPADTRGLSGWDAVILWRQWRHGDRAALDRLLAYNRDDVLNMERLLEAAYPAMLARTLAEEG